MADVATPSAEAKAIADMALLPRTLMGGTKAMRAAGVKYLPMEAAESAGAYAARVNRSTLFNAFRKTVKDMTGKVFNKPIVLKNTVPAQLKAYAENIDLAGRHVNVFARDAFFDSMQPGIGYILTDMPAPLETGTGRNGEVTAADESNAGIRPYLCFVKAEDLIGWQTENIDGVITLTMARIRETATIPNPDDPFSEICVPQIRVLRIGSWEIWREAMDGGPDKGKWVKVSEGLTNLSKIPLAPIYLNRTGFFIGEPPLEDLADLNVAHWQSQSDQRNILHVARVPILFGAGFAEDDTIEIGASRMVRTSASDSKLQYVEHTGAAIEAGRNDLKDLEFQMQTQGLQLLVPQPGGQSATGEILDSAKENSPLAMMAGALQDALEQSFGFMAEFLGLGADAGGEIEVNTDFGLANNVTDIPNIVTSYQSGLLDQQTALDEMKRRGFLSESVETQKILDNTAGMAGPLELRGPVSAGTAGAGLAQPPSA
jgi:hypothetical protein